MTIDMNDPAARERVAQLPDGEQILRNFDMPREYEEAERVIRSIIGPREPRVYRKVREAIPGPVRARRNQERRVRTVALKERLEITGGTGNLMVNLCREGARRSAARNADAAYQRPAAGPHHPNERLGTYLISVALDSDGTPRLAGGTARQQACYRRAVDRYTKDDL